MQETSLEQQIQIQDPLLPRLAAGLRERFPGLIALAFFGSRVAGEPDEYSDYDALLVLPDGLAWRDRWETENDFEKRFGVRLQLTATSPRGVGFYARLAPSFRFWLKDAVIIGQTAVLDGNLPPIARQGCLGSLAEAELDLEDAARKATLYERGKDYYKILRRIIIVEKVIEEDYSYALLRRELEELLGKDLLALLRKPRPRLKKTEVDRMAALAQKKLAEVRAKAEAMPANESDAYLDRMKGHRA